MSKKKVPRNHNRQMGKRSLRKRYLIFGAAGILGALCLGVVAGSGTDWFSAKRFWHRPTRPLSPSPLSSPTPTKEYIYAGGRLIATEEPSNVTLAAPSMTATTASEPPVPVVNITWTPSAGADYYQVERTANVGVSYTVIASNVTNTYFTDSTVGSVTAYLYRVRAANSSGNSSPYSNVDLATAISFTDDTLQAGSTPIKAQHITELRQAINAVRSTANVAAASWEEGVSPGVLVRAAHIQEMRTKLDDARNALALPGCSYTSVGVGVVIQKAHLEELRTCVK